MRRHRVPRLICALALALGVTACGDDEREGSVEESGGSTTGQTGTTGTTDTTGTTGTSTTPTPSGAAGATVKVTETDFEIDPQNPRIAKPGVVRFQVRNAGKAPHALEIEGPGGEVETEEIAPGKSATLNADLSRAGTYKWYCPVGDHEQRGMTGKVTVSRGGSRSGSDRSGGRGGGSGKSGSGSGKRPGAGGGSSGGVY